MLLVRYDSGVSIPAFCSVSDNARDAFVATPRCAPFSFVLFFLVVGRRRFRVNNNEPDRSSVPGDSTGNL